MPHSAPSRRTFVKTVAGTGIGLGLAGCLGDDDSNNSGGDNGNDNEDNGTSSGGEEYSMSFSLPGGTTLAPMMIADELGLWEEYNVDASRNPFTSPADLATNYHSGGSETDFYYGASPLPVARVYNEFPGRVLGKNYGDFFVFVGREEFDSLADLEGASHGSLPPGTSTQFGMSVAVREQFGMDLDEFLEPSYLGPPQMANAVLQGELDAATLWAPYSTEIRDTDGYHIIDSLDAAYKNATGHAPMFAGSAARLSYLEEKRSDIKQMLKVVNDAITEMENNPQLMEDSGFLDFMGIDEGLRDLAKEEINGVFLTEYDPDQIAEDVIFQFEKAVELELIDEMPPEEIVDIIDLGEL